MFRFSKPFLVQQLILAVHLLRRLLTNVTSLAAENKSSAAVLMRRQENESDTSLQRNLA